MESKNLNDIVIEDSDSSKKAQLKNILTLLALLFIILVISIVITKLILGNDGEIEDADSSASSIPSSVSSTITETTPTPATASVSATAKEGEEDSSSGLGTAAAIAAGAGLGVAANHVLSNRNSDKANRPKLIERNISRKRPLRDNSPKDTTTEKHTTSHTTPHRATSHTTRHQDSYVKPKRVTPTRKPRVVHHVSKPKPKPTPRKKKRTLPRGYYIKVGAFKDTTNAVKHVTDNGFKYRTSKIKNSSLTRVLVGPYYSRKDAENDLDRVKETVSKSAYIKRIK